jgi:hypothetical protein
MDANRFDTLTRSLTDVRSRRGALAVVLGGALGVLGLDGLAAKRRKHAKNGKHASSEGKGKKKGNGNKKKKKKGEKQTPYAPPPPGVDPASPPTPPPPPANPSPPPPPPPPPPPVCTPNCPSNQTCQNGRCVCLSGSGVCTLDGSCGQCCLNSDCCNGAMPCPGGTICLPPVNGNRICGCAPGTDSCGGQCLAPCAVARNPQTCGCCRSPGWACGGMVADPCCTGMCNSGTCASLPGAVCTFDGQCFPPFRCRNGVCQPPSP